ncbi:MAG: foldase protein PrsA [Candidatus Cloacimonadia bacterium]
MKKVLVCLIFIFSVSITLAAEEVDGIAAMVGEQIILTSEVEEFYNNWNANPQQPYKITKEEALQILIEDALIMEKARQEGITADETLVEMRLEQIMEQLIANFPSQESFLAALRQEGLTEEELRNQYREEIRKNFIKEALIQQEAFHNIRVSEYEKQQYYETYKDSLPMKPQRAKFAYIVVSPQPDKAKEEETLQKAQEIRRKLVEGENFEDLARQYSACPTAPQGGDLGYFSSGTMIKPFEDVAFSLDIGEISEPVLTEFGYHIIRVDDKRDDEIHAHHILIPLEVDEEDISRAQARIDSIYQKLQTGADFIQLAEEYSDSFFVEEYPVDRLSQVPCFNDVIDKLNPNEFSDVIEIQSNFYIVKHMGLLDPQPYTYDEIADQIELLVLQEKQQKALADWIEKLKEEIYVKVY